VTIWESRLLYVFVFLVLDFFDCAIETVQTVVSIQYRIVMPDIQCIRIHGDMILDLGFWLLAQTAVFFVWVRVGNLVRIHHPWTLLHLAILSSALRNHTLSHFLPQGMVETFASTRAWRYTECDIYTQVPLV
jgi:hypothetical protein